MRTYTVSIPIDTTGVIGAIGHCFGEAISHSDRAMISGGGGVLHSSKRGRAGLVEKVRGVLLGDDLETRSSSSDREQARS